MDVKIRPFEESFDRGQRRTPLHIVGKIEGESLVIEVDDALVQLVTRRIERDEQGAAAWIPTEQELDFDLGRLRVVAQVEGSELLGAEISVRLAGAGVSTGAGFSVFFNLLGQVDGQGTVRAMSEPPLVN